MDGDVRKRSSQLKQSAGRQAVSGKQQGSPYILIQAAVHLHELRELERRGRGVAEKEKQRRVGRSGGGPISSDASLADGLLLLGKITPLVARPPSWPY